MKLTGKPIFLFFRTGIDKEITEADVEVFQNIEYESFDQFEKSAFDIWKITFPPSAADWKKAVCTCPAFDTEYMCKHIIGIARQIGAIETPDVSFDDVPMFPSKRGRPKYATPALRKD